MPALTSPLAVGPLTLANRVIMPPMANNLADEQGRASERLVQHYARHADGGSALMIVEHAYVTPTGRVHPHQLGIHEDGAVEGLSRIAQAIRSGGALAVAQITHGGARCPQEVTGVRPVAPSEVPMPGDEAVPRALSAGEIEQVPALFAAAARRAVAAGFDGVEVHGAHAYLLNEFLSPYANRRSDAYGADEAGRLRLPLAVLAAVRAALGRDRVLLYRLAAEDGVPGGLTTADTARMAPLLAEASVDLLDCSGGLCGSRPASRTEQGFFVSAAAAVRAGLRAAGVDTPVSGVGGITDPEWADRAIRDGSVDAVCVGRAQLKDPAWPRKALAQMGS